MSILADRLPQQCKNVYMLARIGAGFKSRADASEFLPIGERTLAKIETGEKVPSPEEISVMADTYNRQKLLYEYCSELCPVGKQIAVKPEEKDLSGSTIGLLRWIKEVQGDLERLVEIAEDNRITPDEVPDLVITMDKISALWKSIVTYKFYVDCVARINTKEKQPTLVAERQAAYNIL
ncbi:hypothetical protein [Desulfotomaculum sp. 1211_IL3151]|uniref:hypothetical protein n=1 Tax=Desulfotomaculum sp. 1211_IL3151 TaxID=3084055 RepID=UPI002FD9751C